MKKTMPLKMATCIALISGLIQGGGVHAGSYTYMDATPENTTLNGTPLVAGQNYIAGTGNGTDGRWSFRSDNPPGNNTGAATFEGRNFFESDAGTGSGDRENTPDLITEIVLPTPGEYRIVVLFSKNNYRDVAAKIGGSPDFQNTFTSSNGGSAAALAWDGSYAGTRGSSAGAADLGTVVTTTADESVFVYVNGFKSRVGSTVDERTQYDGIGYRKIEEEEPHVPGHRDVFILAGQSNMDGRGRSSQLTGELAPYAAIRTDVMIHYTNPTYNSPDSSRHKTWVPLAPGYSLAPNSSGALPRGTFGPEIGIGAVLAEHFDHPALIKISQGGTSLTNAGSDWYPAPLDSPQAGKLYVALIESTRQALQQLTDAGDTYTVHALFWHQGESDSNSSGQAAYPIVFPTFVDSVRRDLGLPNLRFITGQLAPNRPPAFANLQWQLSRSLRNVSFVSSANLTTSDPQTHFDTASMITLGRRFAHTALFDFDKITFEAPLFAAAPLDRQYDFSSPSPDQPVVAATAGQGGYQGGQAAGHTGNAGGVFFNRGGMLPLAGVRRIQADFFAGDSGYDDDGTANSSLRVHGWKDDVNRDGDFSDEEAAIGFGLENDGSFSIRAGGKIHHASPATYQTDRWYRLALEWSEPDADGKRLVGLHVSDLLTETDLGNGQPLVTATITDEDFGGNPSRWHGIGFYASRGLIDNVSAEPPGFSGWIRRFPGIIGNPDEDPDRDGLSNLAEYAMGLDPTRPDAGTVRPSLAREGGNVILSAPHLSRLQDIRHEAEWSVDLENWTVVQGAEAGGKLHFTAPFGPKIFLRQRFVMSSR